MRKLTLSLLLLAVLAAVAAASPSPKLDAPFVVPATEGVSQAIFRFVDEFGRFHGVYATVGPDGTLTLKTCYLVVGDSVSPPTPPVPPAPDPLTGLAKLVHDWAATLPDDAKAKAPALAASFESIASQMAAGTLKFADEIIKATAEANRTALGDKRDNWVVWAQQLQKHLNAESQAGRLKTVEEHRAAWLDIAKGLRAVK